MAFRSVTFVGAALVASGVLLSSTSVMAQTRSDSDPNRPYANQPAPRPDFPGAKQGDRLEGTDPAKAPRPDFPGPRQSDAPPQK
jgi:hypothetical protein